jgi:dTDP-4-dehydrorhamnose reductase
MRVLVTGANGQLARSLAALAACEPGLTVLVKGRPELDLEAPAAIAPVVAGAAADIVVNAAAYTAVDAAETDSERALAVNGAGAGAVAAAAAAIKAPVIHLSTDYVFSGSGTRPYREDDATGPRTAYGRSKLAGEAAVAAANPDHAILRTAWLYSPFGGNFVKTMLRLARERETISVVNDQLGNPTYVPDLAAAIVAIARRMLAAPGDAALRGIFHLAAPDTASWCEFASEIMATSRAQGGPAARIVAIGSADYKTAAERPRNSRLDCARARAAFGVALPPRRESLEKCVRELLGPSA